MSDRSKIEWTDATWNPIRARDPETGNVGHYCELISPGCLHCYASRFQPRKGLPTYAGAAKREERLDQLELILDGDVLAKPLHWKKPRMVFVCSMTDLFGEWVPLAWIDDCFAMMWAAQWHTFQVLTKRPGIMAAYLNCPKVIQSIADRAHHFLRHREPEKAKVVTFQDIYGDIKENWPLRNVWLGTSVENKTTLHQRAPHLIECPATIRFFSAEPLLEEINVIPYIGGATYRCRCGFHPTENELIFRGGQDYQCASCFETCRRGEAVKWVICGCESGPKRRLMKTEWAESLSDQCADAMCDFFLKQMEIGGKVSHDIESFPPGLRVREFPQVEVRT